MREGKGKEAKLVFMAHALMGNRHGLVSDFRLTEANGMAERDAATHASERSSMTWVRSVCRTQVRLSEVIITHRPRYKVRKRVESIFGWMKTVGAFEEVGIAGWREPDCMESWWLPCTTS